MLVYYECFEQFAEERWYYLMILGFAAALA